MLEVLLGMLLMASNLAADSEEPVSLSHRLVGIDRSR